MWLENTLFLKKQQRLDTSATHCLTNLIAGNTITTMV